MSIFDYTGHQLQLYGVQKLIIAEGKGKGLEVLRVRNQSGLDFYLLIDRALDFGQLLLNGVNLSYLSTAGYVHPHYYDYEGNGFLKSFTAGFMTTCGLTQVGSANNDNGEELPLHGTVAHLPASNVSYKLTNDEIIIKGTIFDETIFAYKLVMERTIIVALKENVIQIIDKITNRGDLLTPHQIIYHCNFGYPFLNEKTKIKINSKNHYGRDENAKHFISEFDQIKPPTAGFVERCYFHQFDENKPGNAEIINDEMNIKVVLSFNPNDLNCLTQWNLFNKRDYVLGIEPGNAFPIGRSASRKEGSLQFINPNESVIHQLTIKFSEVKK